jgi:hypothetical protein
MPDIDLILALTPMVMFWAAVLWASAWIAPRTKRKEDQ